MQRVPWRPVDLDAACGEAKITNKFVLIDFFSPRWGGCGALAAVSYPEATVVATITDHFVPLQIDTTDDANAPLVQRFRQIWTPDLRVLDPDGFEYDAWQGYWPPAEFTARLLLGRGHCQLAGLLGDMGMVGSAGSIFGVVVRLLWSCR